MLNVNSNPNIMARIPIMILLAVNPASINVIPKKNKLIPIMIDTTPELKTGKIIKINPKIMDNIPDILIGSIVFPPNFFMFTFSSEKYKNSKSNTLFRILFIIYVIYFFILSFFGVIVFG